MRKRAAARRETTDMTDVKGKLDAVPEEIVKVQPLVTHEALKGQPDRKLTPIVNNPTRRMEIVRGEMMKRLQSEQARNDEEDASPVDPDDKSDMDVSVGSHESLPSVNEPLGEDAVSAVTDGAGVGLDKSRDASGAPKLRDESQPKPREEEPDEFKVRTEKYTYASDRSDANSDMGLISEMSSVDVVITPRFELKKKQVESISQILDAMDYSDPQREWLTKLQKPLATAEEAEDALSAIREMTRRFNSDPERAKLNYTLALSLQNVIEEVAPYSSNPHLEQYLVPSVQRSLHVLGTTKQELCRCSVCAVPCHRRANWSLVASCQNPFCLCTECMIEHCSNRQQSKSLPVYDVTQLNEVLSKSIAIRSDLLVSDIAVLDLKPAAHGPPEQKADNPEELEEGDQEKLRTQLFINRVEIPATDPSKAVDEEFKPESVDYGDESESDPQPKKKLRTVPSEEVAIQEASGAPKQACKLQPVDWEEYSRNYYDDKLIREVLLAWKEYKAQLKDMAFLAWKAFIGFWGQKRTLAVSDVILKKRQRCLLHEAMGYFEPEYSLRREISDYATKMKTPIILPMSLVELAKVLICYRSTLVS